MTRPQTLGPLRWDHPLAHNLYAAVAAQGAYMHDFVAGRNLTPHGGATVSIGQTGLASKLSAASSQYWSASWLQDFSTKYARMSITALASSTDNATDQVMVGIWRSSANDTGLKSWLDIMHRLENYVRDENASIYHWRGADKSVPRGEMLSMSWQWDKAVPSGFAVLDGVKQSVSAVTSGTGTSFLSAGKDLLIGAENNDAGTISQFWNGEIGQVLIHTVPLPQDVLEEFHFDPWALWRYPRSIYLYKPTAAITYQYARPNADQVDGGWLNEAGSNINLFASIDEVTASDADYIQSANDPASDVCIVKLSSLSDPASSTDHIVRYRIAKNDAAAASVSVTVSLTQGTGATETVIASWSHTDIPGDATTHSQTLTTAQADAITDYADLYLKFSAVTP